jgi:hypothetical protein
MTNLHQKSYFSRVLFFAGFALQLSFLISQGEGEFWRPFFADARHEPRNIDFFTLYEAGHRALRGVDAYAGTDTNNTPLASPFDRVSAMRYTPASAFIFGIPIRCLGPPRLAEAVWQLLLRGMLVVALVLIWRACGNARREEFYFVGGMWLLFPPFYVELQLGQYSLLMALFLLMAYLSWQSNQPGKGALFWTLSLLLKSWSILFVPFLWLSGRRRTVAFGLGVLVLATVPYFVLYPEGWAMFRGQNASAPQLLDWHTHISHMGMPALYAAVFSPLIEGPILFSIKGYAVAPGHLLGWTITGALLLGALWATIRNRKGSVAAGFALWSCAFFLIYRDVWENHYLMLLPALTALALDGKSKTRMRWIALSFFLIALPTPYRLWLDAPFNALTDVQLFEKNWSYLQSIIYHVMRPAGVLILYAIAMKELIGLKSKQNNQETKTLET